LQAITSKIGNIQRQIEKLSVECDENLGRTGAQMHSHS